MLMRRYFVSLAALFLSSLVNSLCCSPPAYFRGRVSGSSLNTRKFMRCGNLNLWLAALAYLVFLYMRDLLYPPEDEKDFTFSFRLYDDIRKVIREIEDDTFDTFPFDRKTLVRPFFRYKELFKVSPKYSLTTCQIEKTTSLLKDAIFCFLKNPWKFKAQGRNISTEQYFTRQCRNEYLAKNYTLVGRSLGRIKFAVLRDPIDRFLSGYVDKCLLRPKDAETRCFACKGDFNCFVESFYQKLMDVYKNQDNTYHFEVAHMAPQTWYCNFKDHLEEYTFVLYQKCKSSYKLAMEFDKIFEMAGVPEPFRREIIKEILVGRTPHTTRDSPQRLRTERQLFDNRTLLDLVLKMFYYDYKIFGFSLPGL